MRTTVTWHTISSSTYTTILTVLTVAIVAFPFLPFIPSIIVAVLVGLRRLHLSLSIFDPDSIPATHTDYVYLSVCAYISMSLCPTMQRNTHTRQTPKVIVCSPPPRVDANTRFDCPDMVPPLFWNVQQVTGQ